MKKNLMRAKDSYGIHLKRDQDFRANKTDVATKSLQIDAEEAILMLLDQSGDVARPDIIGPDTTRPTSSLCDRCEFAFRAKETELNECKRIAGDHGGAFSPDRKSLTPREHDVLCQIMSGASNKEAALKLGISHRTVEVHRSRIMEKLGAKNLVELVRIAVFENWVPMARA